MDIGKRLIYDQDGEIIVELGEMSGDVLPRKELTNIDYVDLDFGSINYATHRILKVDTSTKQPVLEEIPNVLSPEQQRIQELEAQVASLTDELNQYK